MTADKKEEKVTGGSVLIRCTNLSVKSNLYHKLMLKANKQV